MRKPLPFRVCRNSTKPVSTCSSYSGEQLCLLARRDSTVRSPGILERMWTLSLSLKIYFLFSLLFLVPKPVGRAWVKRTCPLMPHVKAPLVGLDFLIHLSLYFGIFIKWHHAMWTHGPHLSSCLTNSAHDMWHLLSHSKCVKCPVLPPLPRKT